MEIIKRNNGGLSPSAGEQFNGMIKGVSKFFMMVVFLGTIMLWIMMPTLTYRNKWLPYMRLKFGASTYFGSSGLKDQIKNGFTTPAINHYFTLINSYTFLGSSDCYKHKCLCLVIFSF